jgi:murein DD-endopeptidase MepM/ murein hydrolase activator NlpD
MNKFFLFFIVLITACTNLPLTEKVSYCSFPAHKPYPGGMVNYRFMDFDIDLDEELAAEGLKYEVCRENSSSVNLLIPIPLSFEKEYLKISLSNKLISSIDIENKFYRESRITINNQDMVKPPVSMQERIKEEYIKGIALKNVFTDQNLKLREMIMPVTGLKSSEFGVRRYINGQPRNRHTGLDIAANEGVSVIAPLSGIVILADNFFYKGNVIYIDHGNGLITSYSHLNKKIVTLGQSVSKGQTLGSVGSTGRVTGPHLHWEVFFLGIPVNPEIFVKEEI